VGYLPAETFPSLIVNVASPDAVAEEPVFFTVTVQGPLPTSRVELAPIDVCVVVLHFSRMSWELESRFATFTAKEAGATRAITVTANKILIACSLPAIHPPIQPGKSQSTPGKCRKTLRPIPDPSGYAATPTAEPGNSPTSSAPTSSSANRENKAQSLTRQLQIPLLLQDLGIHRIRCQINLPRPRHRTRIHKHLPEKPGILESSKHASELLRSQLDLSRNTVPKTHE
jgi:hypothetical protein